jgi:hypothetical protein
MLNITTAFSVVLFVCLMMRAALWSRKGTRNSGIGLKWEAETGYKDPDRYKTEANIRVCV